MNLGNEARQKCHNVNHLISLLTSIMLYGWANCAIDTKSLTDSEQPENGLHFNTSGMNLCYLCIGSPTKTLTNTLLVNKSSYNDDVLKGRCFHSGAYDLFCDTTSAHNGSTECLSIISVLPPTDSERWCRIKVINNKGMLDDSLYIRRDGHIEGTNHSWYAQPLKRNSGTVEPLQYNIYKRIGSKDDFKGNTQCVSMMSNANYTP